MTKVQRIHEILNEGPATAREVGAELGMNIRLASAHLADLCRRGIVTSRPFHGEGYHRESVNLYSLVGQ